MSRNSLNEVVEVNLPSNTRHLHAMRILTSTLAESMGFERNDSEKTALAVEEALTNVMEHSYHGEENRRMQVIFEMKGEKLTIRILHNGDQIQANQIGRNDEFTDFIAQKKKGGLGVLIMKRCMDEVTYKSGDPLNECCMIKYLKKG